MSDLNLQLQQGIELQQRGQLDEAAQCYTDILQRFPGHADANHLLGLVSFQKGRHSNALEFIDKAIAECPEIAMYHANRGRILKAVGNNVAAASAYSRALRLQPGEGITLSDLAGVLLVSGNPDTAILFAKRAVERAPNLAAAHYNYGLSAKLMKQIKLAYSAFEKTLELEPGFAAALFELGHLCQISDDLESAETFYLRALVADSTLFEAHVNLGNILRGNFELEEAVFHYRKALKIEPEEANVHANLGVALQEQGNTEEALRAYDRSISLDPENAEAQRNKAQLLLQLGRYREGWPAFEWRWKTRHFASIRRDWKYPQWNGQTGNDITVLVHAEQGFGDTIQFSRYLPILAERVGRVVVECPLQLTSLIAGCQGVDEVIGSGFPLPGYDYQIPMMSFPGVFGTVLETIPANVPYLGVASKSHEVWADRIGGDGLLKVGVVWKGSRRHQRNVWRSPGLVEMGELFDLPGVHWVSLQKDDEIKDLQLEGMSAKITALGSSLRDFSDTAAVITNLDLVISPDTAVAHLAGALNCPVWLILPHVSEWRWLVDCHDSPWYPSMRLFRQALRQDWSSPIHKMIDELKNLTL